MTATTAVDSERNVDQFTETTSRDASQERRELLSFTTAVENVLTLLTAKHIGSPYVSYMLWPRPIHALFVSPQDPGVWYSELLNRRSSGIEGVQEFVVMLAVPRTMRGFCLHARMRRIAVVDDPPAPPDPMAIADKLVSPEEQNAIYEYLQTRYPTGSPTDDLDVDLDLDASLSSASVIKHIVGGPRLVRILGLAVSPADKSDSTSQGTIFYVPYKTLFEARLDMLRANYERDLATSPLERGFGEMRELTLNTCFDVDEAGGLSVNTFGLLGSQIVLFHPKELLTAKLDVAALGDTPFPKQRYKYSQAILRWNGLQRDLATRLSTLAEVPSLEPSDPRVADVFLRRWQKLAGDDKGNLGLDEAAARFGLTPAQARALRAVGARDLRGIADALQAAASIERYNQEIKEVELPAPRRARKGQAPKRRPKPEPIAFSLTAADANAIRDAIAKSLAV
jgi:hypothetical protein